VAWEGEEMMNKWEEEDMMMVWEEEVA